MIATALLALAGFTIPPLPKDYITDPPGMLSVEKINQLGDELHKFEVDTGDYVIVWIGKSTGNVPVEKWTAQVTSAWKIGFTYDDSGGAVLFVFTDTHRVQIVTTGDAKRLTAARAAQIADGTIRPALFAGHADAAIQSGIDAMLREIKPPDDAPTAKPAIVQATRSPAPEGPLAALRDRSPASASSSAPSLPVSGPLAAAPAFPSAAITDTLGALPADEITKRTQELARFQQLTTYRMLLWVGKAPAGEHIESWTARTWSAWKAHAGKPPLGGILFVFPDRKTARVERDGHFISAADAAEVVNTKMIEPLAAGHVDVAVSDGLDALLTQMYSGWAPDETKRPFEHYGSALAAFSDVATTVLAVLFGIALVVGFIMMIVITIVRRGHRHGDWLDAFLMSREMGPSNFGIAKERGGGGFMGTVGAVLSASGGLSGGGGSFGGGGASGSW